MNNVNVNHVQILRFLFTVTRKELSSNFTKVYSTLHHHVSNIFINNIST